MPVVVENRYFIPIETTDYYLTTADSISDKFLLGNLIDQYGFFYPSCFNEHLRKITDLAALPGAILIAEGGMGKTCVMDYLSANIPKESFQCKIAAGDYLGCSSELLSKLNNLPDGIKYIFVDGIDEATDLIPMLSRKLGEFQNNGVSIFIASRNIQQLESISKKLSLPAYSLLPLSKDDVSKIAEFEKVDPLAFIDKVICEGLAPICSKPLGCKALLQGYKKDKLQNSSSETLWKNAVLSLCAENDSPSRGLIDDSPSISPNECLEHVAKIALILKLAGRTVIRGLQETLPDEGEKQVSLSQLYDSSDDKKIRKILSRAIFLPIGNNSFKFAHISYFDYLAAIGMITWVNRKLWDSIMLSPDKSSIYPQWEGVAAWLASNDAEWQKKILEIQPELLLVSDLAIRTIGAEELCQSLIERVNTLDRGSWHAAALIKRLAKLDDPAIIPVLERALSSDSSMDQKELAIRIICECKIRVLEPKLVAIFCDQNEDLLLRKKAGFALVRFAAPESRTKCKVILQELGCDLDLKGYLFEMTWPELISLDEIEPHLTRQKRLIFDSYELWISCEFPKSLLGLSEQQLKAALKWAINGITKPIGNHDPILEMRRQIFTLCWRKFAYGDFMPLLANGFLSFIKEHVIPLANRPTHDTPELLRCTVADFYSDIAKRHNLAMEIMKMQSVSGSEITNFLLHLVDQNDFDFVFKMINDNLNNELGKKWTIVLRNLSRYGIPTQKIIDWDDMHQRFPDIICQDAETINQKLKEDEAEVLRNRQRYKIREENEERQINAQFDKIRSLIHTEKVDQHFSAIAHFFIDDGNNSIDYRQSPKLQLLSVFEIQQIANAAKLFFIEAKASEYPRQKGYYYLVVPWGFFLVWSVLGDKLNSFLPEIWKKFSLLLFDSIGFDHQGILRPIFEWMHKSAPSIFYDSSLEKIKSDIIDGVIYSTFLEQYGHLFDDNTCKEIIDLTKLSECNKQQRFRILDAVYKFSPGLVKKFLSENAIAWEHDIAKYDNGMSILILKVFPDKIHNAVKHLAEDSEWGKRWMEDLISIYIDEKDIIPIFQFAELDDLAQFYIWLHKNYPKNQRADVDCAGFSTSIDTIHSFTDYHLLNLIKNHPSSNVLNVMQQIWDSFPEDEWMKYVIQDIKKDSLKRNTPTYKLDEIKRILDKDEQGIIINSPQDLFSLILDLLEKYQIYLTGKESPGVDDLWNYNSRKKPTHKDEEHFSDHLKRFLEPRLVGVTIAINREVQLNRGLGGQPGSRTDIWINAFSKHSHPEKITLCIEVKGSWNNSALSAMNEQLTKKYMGDGGADAGILLIGWFHSKKYHVSNICNDKREDAEKELNSQTEQANQNGYLVQSFFVDCPAKY